MSIGLTTLIERIRTAKGPFFVARVGLRIKFSLTNTNTEDTEDNRKQVIDACRALGFDPLSPTLEAKK